MEVQASYLLEPTLHWTLAQVAANLPIAVELMSNLEMM